MPERLPAELVGAILQEAVELFVASDRHTAVSIALTARFVYQLVRPILFRRLVMTHQNKAEIERLLRRNEINDLVLDLCFTQSVWSPGPIASAFTQLRCIRGYQDPVVNVLTGLSPSSQFTLHKLQLWRLLPISGLNIPPSVTHLCLFNPEIDIPSSELAAAVAAWAAAIPALTHLGLELVVLVDADSSDDARLEPEPEELARGLEMAIQASGEHLQQLSIRLCASVSESWWQRLLDALQVRTRESSTGLKMAQKIRLWRDERVPTSLHEDLVQSAEYFRGGIDVWSEGRPLSEFQRR